jgi:hypothetical protein
MTGKSNPKGKPRRSLSAYNFFFRDERQRMLAALERGDPPTDDTRQVARYIGKRWKNVPPRNKLNYEERAAKDKRRFAFQMIEWRRRQEELRDWQPNEVEASRDAPTTKVTPSSCVILPVRVENAPDFTTMSSPVDSPWTPDPVASPEDSMPLCFAYQPPALRRPPSQEGDRMAQLAHNLGSEGVAFMVNAFCSNTAG